MGRFAVAVGMALAGLGCATEDGGGGAGAAGGAPTAAVGGTTAAGTGGTTAAGTGGTTATAGAGGTMAAGSGGTAAGTGGTAAGSGGTTAAGTGGTTAAGSGGTAAAGDGGTGDLTMCISEVMASGRDMTCASCLCGMCNPELMAVDGDVNAQAMLDCISTNNCSGSCCLCNAADCTAAAADFGNGPCGNEIQTAAGVTPMTGLLGAIANGSMVSANCAPAGPTGNSCADAARLGDCLTMHCMAECPSTATCM